MKRIKLTREEKAIEDALLRGEYVDVSPAKFKGMAEALESFKRKTKAKTKK